MLRQVNEKQAEIHDADGQPDGLPLREAGALVADDLAASDHLISVQGRLDEPEEEGDGDCRKRGRSFARRNRRRTWRIEPGPHCRCA